MWSTTFRGAIECGNMFITKITLNKTIRYNVNLLIAIFSTFLNTIADGFNFINSLNGFVL